MTSDHEIALKGAMDYGTDVFPATFDPGCDAYRAVKSNKPRTTFFSAKSVEPMTASLSTLFSTTDEESYPLEFFRNFTNQPTFADGKTCDNLIRLFDTNVTTMHGIEPIRGTVKVRMPPFVGDQEWTDVYGLRLDTAFIENNYLSCDSFRGYSGHQ